MPQNTTDSKTSKEGNAEPVTLDHEEELARQARQRAHDHGHYLRSSIAATTREALLAGGLQDLRDGAISGIGGFIGSDADVDELTPPPNFSLVWKGVYRSSFPKQDHFDHLKSLGLKSILTLVPEDYPEANVAFMRENGIEHHQISMPGNKEPFVKIPPEAIRAALTVVLNRRNHPILIHCNKGKHRTGCVVGCLRKLQKWALSSIFQEYRDHSEPKSRHLDEQFIELFDERSLIRLARRGNWILGENQTVSTTIDGIGTHQPPAFRRTEIGTEAYVQS